MTIDEAINILKQYVDYDNLDVPDFYTMEEAIKVIIKALEQEPCGGCISRQAAIDLADELKDDLPDDDHLSDMIMSHNEGILEYQTKLSLLPPVTPQPKTGHWIETDMYDESVYKCSCCGESYCMEYGSPEEYGYIYCPCCGCKMQEVE